MYTMSQAILLGRKYIRHRCEFVNRDFKIKSDMNSVQYGIELCDTQTTAAVKLMFP